LKLDVIDANVHVGESIYGLTLSETSLLKSMKHHEIDFAVISSFTPPNLDFEKADAFIRKIVRAHPRHFLGSATADPRLGRKSVASLKRFLHFKEFGAITLHPFEQAFKVNSEIVFPVYEMAEKLGCPVILESGYPIVSLPGQIAEVAGEFKKVKFVMTHCGQLLASGQSEADAFSAIIENPNIYAETSQVILSGIGGFIEQLVSDGGNNVRNRIVYGSNSPFGDPSVELMRVQMASIDDIEKEKILSANSRALFGL
jgi:predicted TIM-barrel fold metal-dependent hydrolase